MKILHIIISLPLAGAERNLYNIVKYDKKNEHKIIVIGKLGELGLEMKEKGVNIDVLNMESIYSILMGFSRIIKILNDFGPKLVMGWMYYGNILCALLRIFKGKSYIFIWTVRHSLSSIQLEKPFMRLMIRLNSLLSKYANAILFNSYSSLEQHKHFGFSPSNLFLIQNGFESPKNKKNNLRELLSITKNSFVFGYIARSHPMKNHKGFILSAIKILEMGFDADFILAGKEINLSNKELISLVPNIYLGRFHFLGINRSSSDVMSSIDCLCVFSKWGEGFPNVIGEAMMNKVICISTNVGDAGYLLDHGRGIITENMKTDSFVRAMSNVYLQTNPQREYMENKAKRFISENFSISKVIDHYQDFFNYVSKPK